MATPTEEESLQLSVSNFGPIAKAEIDLRPANRVCRSQQHREILLGNVGIYTTQTFQRLHQIKFCWIWENGEHFREKHQREPPVS